MRRAFPGSLLVALVLLSARPSLFSEEALQRITVLPFTASEGVSEADASSLGRIFEAAVIKTKAFDVIEQAERDAVLKAQEDTVSGCSDEGCAVEIGRLLTASQIFLGHVSKIGSKIIVTVKLIDIAKGRSLRAENAESTSLEGLTVEMPVLANSLAGGEVFGGRGKIVVQEEKAEEEKSTASTATREVVATVFFESEPDGVSFKVCDAAGRLLRDGITPTALRLTAATYSVEASDAQDLYYPFKDRLTVSREGRMTFTIAMKPNFGGVEIQSDPPGADVLLKGMKIGTTPFRQDKLRSGVYELLLKKDLYESKPVSVKVEDGKTARLTEPLLSAFMVLSVSEEKAVPATLYLDEVPVGKLPVTRKIAFRDCEIRIVPDDERYHEYSEKVSARSRGQEIIRKVTLDGSFGSVWVTTEPFLKDGQVLVDSRGAGTAGDEFNLLVGDYEISARGMYKDQLYSGRQKVKVDEGACVQVTLRVTPDKYQAVISGWVERLDSLSGLLQRKAKISAQHVSSAQGLVQEIREAGFSLPEYAARATVLADALKAEKVRQDREEKVASLTLELEALHARRDEAKKARGTLDAWGWISLASGAVLAGASGVLWYLSESAYSSYQAATLTANTVALRGQVELYDGLKLGSGIPGLIGLIVSPILFSVGPRPQILEKDIQAMDAQIRALGEGAKR